MLYKKLNERTQNRSKNLIEQIVDEKNDFDESLLTPELMGKIISINWHTILLEEKIDWISSERSKY